MLSTAIAILSAIALLSPGFVIVELSDARRARAKRSDLELALRAVTYAVFVHLAFGWWTAKLVGDVGDVRHFDQHLGAVSAYVGVVLVLVPILLGTLISAYVGHVERQPGSPGLLASALGAGQARDAFDFAFQQHQQGAWVIVRLAGTGDNPEYVGGVYGAGSAIGQTPSPHDIYLENVAQVETDDNGVPYIATLADPPQGVYLPAEQIGRIDVIPNRDAAS